MQSTHHQIEDKTIKQKLKHLNISLQAVTDSVWSLVRTSNIAKANNGGIQFVIFTALIMCELNSDIKILYIKPLTWENICVFRSTVTSITILNITFNLKLWRV